MANVLLVEDDPAARQGLELALRRLGHGVCPAETGEAALRDIRTVPVDVVVLHVKLPGLNGFEVCRQLRRHGDVPIIMLTARGDDLDIVGGLVDTSVAMSGQPSRDDGDRQELPATPRDGERQDRIDRMMVRRAMTTRTPGSGGKRRRPARWPQPLRSRF